MNPQGAIPRVALSVLAGACLLQACSPAREPVTPSTQASGDGPAGELGPTEPYAFATSAPPLDATPIDGTYERTITLREAGGQPVYCARCAPYRTDPGDYMLRLEQGRFFVDFEPVPTERKCAKCKLPPGFSSSGHFSVSGEEILLFNDVNCTDTVGRYRWTLDGDMLTFEVIDDECPFADLRARFFTSSAWSTK